MKGRVNEYALQLVLQVICAAAAIASLPSGEIPGVWLAAFILPSAALLFMNSGKPRRWLPGGARFAIAVVLQVAAAYTAYFVAGSIEKKSVLACSLLPALTYFTFRREPSDGSLSLFLSFCFLLIGIMLNRESADWTLLVYLVSCAWALQIEASNRALQVRHAARSPEAPVLSRALRRISVVVALMIASFLGYFALDWLPAPGQQRGGPQHSRPTTPTGASTGVSQQFVFGRGRGGPLNIRASELLAVTNPLGRSLPDDLYLRMTYFDRAGLDEWKKWPGQSTTQSIRGRQFACREEVPGMPRHRLLVRRVDTSEFEGEMYLPPGTIFLQGPSVLTFDNLMGSYRTRDLDSPGYRVDYQRPHVYPRTRFGIDSTIAGREARRLPSGLRTPAMVALARSLAEGVRKDAPAIQLAEALAAGLQARCRYSLQDPVGPFGDPIHNFLFAERQGYCMHFATALAILLRIHNVPCRVAVGLHAGQPDPESPGVRIFGSQHAHAWVELPLRQIGWTVVDPTPAADRARQGLPDLTPAETSAGDDEESAARSCFLATWMPFLERPLKVLTAPLDHLGTFLALTAALLVVSVLALLSIARRRVRVSGRAADKKPTPDSLRARRVLERILHELARRGYPKRHGSTLEQFLSQVRRETRDLDDAVLFRAFAAYQDVRFGAKPLDADREAQLIAGLDVVRELAGS